MTGACETRGIMPLSSTVPVDMTTIPTSRDVGYKYRTVVDGSVRLVRSDCLAAHAALFAAKLCFAVDRQPLIAAMPPSF